jgi:hypothetical protein
MTAASPVPDPYLNVLAQRITDARDEICHLRQSTEERQRVLDAVIAAFTTRSRQLGYDPERVREHLGAIHAQPTQRSLPFSTAHTKRMARFEVPLPNVVSQAPATQHPQASEENVVQLLKDFLREKRLIRTEFYAGCVRSYHGAPTTP